MNERRYKEYLKPLDRALRQLLLDFEFFLEDVNTINVYSISSRLKSFRSAEQKSIRLKMDIEKLQDLAGIRIVVATQHEVEVVARFFSRQEDSKDLEIKSDKKISKKDGYQARHIVLIYQSNYRRSMFPACIEIQLQTIFEHAFNYLSRSWVYKGEKSFSQHWQSDFNKLSCDLRELDKLATKLHNAVIDSSATEEDGAPLSPLSYQRIVHSVFQENISISDAVDSCRMITELGCNTNGDLKKFFKHPQIHDLREKLISLRSPNGTIIAEYAAKMSRHSFWTFWGLRLEYTHELIEKIEATEEEKKGAG